MSIVTISADQRVVDRVNKLLSDVPNALDKVLKSSSARTEQAGRTAMSKEVTARYHISATNVKERSKSRVRVTPTGIDVIFSGSVISLTRYSTRFTTGGKVSVAVKRDASPTEMSRAFVATFKSGHTGVFERSGKDRLPIGEIFGPSIPGILKNEELQQPIGEKMLETFEKRVEHEISRIINAR